MVSACACGRQIGVQRVYTAGNRAGEICVVTVVGWVPWKGHAYARNVCR
jgi:hypothetical protein